MNPSGKLPLTFPKSEADLPHPIHVGPPKPDADHPVPKLAGAPGLIGMAMGIGPFFDVNYDEGLKVGYKWYDAEKKPVLFPIRLRPLLHHLRLLWRSRSRPGDATTVSFTVKNTGKRKGSEIAQVYASPAGLGRRTAEPFGRLDKDRPCTRRVKAGYRHRQPRSSDMFLMKGPIPGSCLPANTPSGPEHPLAIFRCSRQSHSRNEHL